MTGDVIIIGVDPGDSMGVAALRNGKLIFTFQGTASDAVVGIEILLDHAKPEDQVTIACERYTQMGGRVRTHQPRAQQLVGVVEAIAAKYGVRYVEQGPSDARALADNEVLRKLGLFQSGIDFGHDADDVNMAVRHAVLCMAKLHATIFDEMTRDK